VNADVWTWRPEPDPHARLRLVCIPYAGGAPTAFRRWPHLVPRGVEICAAQLPGRGLRRSEAPLACMEAIVNDGLRGLRAFRDRPFALFGHSFGAWIAFELARALRRAGERAPVHLLVSGAKAPHLHRAKEPAALTDDALVAQLLEWNGTPREILDSPEMIQLFLPSIRADYLAYNRYGSREEAPLDVPITAFGGLRDTLVSEEQVAAWSRHTTAAFDAQRIPGDHFFIATRQAVFGAALHATLRTVLAKCEEQR
jgi:medium-chain acyl-[acyl-carrier-protein] hydrolase